MKLTLFSFLFVFSLHSMADTFFPENDLWKEDSTKKRSNITEAMFNQIIDIADEIYQPLADERGEYLTIYRKWNDSTVNASTSRFFGYVSVNMYGGLARRDEITPEGFTLVLCHELGHAYGGYPYISTWNEISAEGQADYYGASQCHDQIMKKLGLVGYNYETTQFMEDACTNDYQKDNKEWCMRGLIGGQSLGHLLAVVKKQAIPNFETPDPTVVDQTLMSYPETIQCRLDTYFNGIMGLERPQCWFRD